MLLYTRLFFLLLLVKLLLFGYEWVGIWLNLKLCGSSISLLYWRKYGIIIICMLTLYVSLCFDVLRFGFLGFMLPPELDFKDSSMRKSD